MTGPQDRPGRPVTSASAAGGGLTVLSALSVIDCIVAAATRDGGTAVLSKGAWRARAAAALGAQARRGRASGLLLVDVDGFKQVNDRVGHLAGDEVLCAVVEAIQSEVRGVDLVGRVGGDEFAALLCTDQDARSVVGVGDRIRARVAGLRLEIDTPSGPTELGAVTVSIGAALISPCRGDGRAQTATALVSATWSADRALYRAKSAGRDTVCLGPPVPPTLPRCSPSPGRDGEST